MSRIIEHRAREQLSFGVSHEDAGEKSAGISLPTKLASVILPTLVALASWSGAAAGETPDSHKNPATNSRADAGEWQQISSKHSPCCWPNGSWGEPAPMAIVYDQKKDQLVDVTGNITSSGSYAGGLNVSVYDFSADNWKNVGYFSSKAVVMDDAVYDVQSGKIIVFAGDVNNTYENYTSYILTYNPDNSAWETKLVTKDISRSKIAYSEKYDKVFVLADQNLLSYDEKTNKLTKLIQNITPTNLVNANVLVCDDANDKLIIVTDRGSIWSYGLVSGVFSQEKEIGQMKWIDDAVYIPTSRQIFSHWVMVDGAGSFENEISVYDSSAKSLVRLNYSSDYCLRQLDFDSKRGKVVSVSDKGVWERSPVIQNPQLTQDSHIVQLTDTHIGAKGADKDLQKMVNRILHFGTKPKYVLVTGDIVDFGYGDDGAANYRKFVQLIAPLENAGIKVYTVPGNHDWRASDDKVGSQPYFGGLEDIMQTRLNNYKTIVGDRDLSGKVIDDGNYVIVGLDSGHDVLFDSNYPIVSPRGSGLKDMQISWLENSLDSLDGKLDGKDTSGKEKIILTHHPDYNQVLLSQSGVISQNQDEFLKICRDYGVNVVLSGHTHENSVQTKDNTRYVQTASATYDLTWRNVTVMYVNNQARVVVSNPQILQKTITARTGCPADISVYDSSGKQVEPRVKSVFAVDDKGSKETELSVNYEPNLQFRVTGTADANKTSTYNIDIRQNSETNNTPVVAGEKIPIDRGAVHEYAWNLKESVTVRLDYDGDGKFDRTINEGSKLVADDFKKPNILAKPKDNAMVYAGAGAAVAGSAAAAGAYLFYRRRKGEGNATLGYHVQQSNGPDNPYKY
ncbi:MAG: metallophosphoesterase [DPANN group archaeon]|nr:metallophosphoesterase [DPANN group archaeon]